MLSEIPSILFYEKRTVFGKWIFDTDTCTFDIRKEIGKNIPLWVLVDFMHSDKIDDQIRDHNIFDWLLVSCAVCRLGTDRYGDIHMIFDYPSNNFHQGYFWKKNFFPKHTEDRVIKPFIDINWFGRNFVFYVFDVSNKNFAHFCTFSKRELLIWWIIQHLL